VTDERGILLVDANILIDYLAGDLSVLTLVSKHIGQVYVPSTVLGEAVELTATECEDHGLTVVEPTLAQATFAAVKRGRLSPQDHTCLVLSRDHGWTCVTNDKRLRKACEEDDVELLWGLELMTLLVLKGQLEAEDAIDVANRIHADNPLHITPAILERFRQKVLSAS